MNIRIDNFWAFSLAIALMLCCCFFGNATAAANKSKVEQTVLHLQQTIKETIYGK